MLKRAQELLAILRRFGVSLRLMAFLFAMSLLSIVCEGLGISLLLPVFELLRAGGSVDIAELKGRHWEIMRYISEGVGIPITLGLLLAISFIFVLLRQLIAYVNELTQSMAKRRIEDQFRQRTFFGFLRAGTTVQEQSRIGEITGHLTVELKRAMLAVFNLVPALSRVLQMALYVTALFFLSTSMTLLAILMIGFSAFLARGYLSEIKRTGAGITDANGQLTTFMVERLKHARLIRLSGTERAEAGAFAKLSRRLAEQSMRQTVIGARLMLLPEPVAVGFALLALFVGVQLLGLSLGALALFVVVLIRLLPIIRSMISDHNTIVGKWPALQRVDQHLKIILESREEKGGSKTFKRLDHGISYDQVSFSYVGSDAPVLRDVSVVLPAHRISAIIGPSGAGKSTFVDLLPRLRDPSAGEIRFGNVPIKEFTTESLRQGIAFVPQQPQIFNISAAEHIRYGKEDATDAEVREAARLAGALGFIEALPQGFETLLGDGGLRLSGGQRQRLDIARALVRRAPILILDEPTSSLDAEAENAFRDALRTLRAETDLTIIVIAHRVTTLADADQVVVLRQGRIESVGSHLTEGWDAATYAAQVGGRSLDCVGPDAA